MILTLCGSARFEPWFHLWIEALGLSGHPAFGLSAWPSHKEDKKEWYSDEQKRRLDQLHLDKIMASDAILVVNAFGYLGPSTLNEIAFAVKHKKPVYAMESWGEGRGVGASHSDALTTAAVERYKLTLPVRSPIDMVYDRAGCHCPWDLLPEAGSYRSAIVQDIYQAQERALKVGSS